MRIYQTFVPTEKSGAVTSSAEFDPPSRTAEVKFIEWVRGGASITWLDREET